MSSAKSHATFTKRPRATTAQDIFAETCKEDVRHQLQVELKEAGDTPQGGNVRHHRVVKNAMYEKLPTSEKAKFEELAAEHNTMIKGPPPADHIYQNQGTIIEHVAQYLASLDGNDWGQCGDVVFFLQGAYRDAEGATKTFHINYDKRSGKKFELALNDWPTVRKAFSRWAKEALHVVPPATVPAPSASITYSSDGSPCLPSIDLKAVVPFIDLLETFITAAWRHVVHTNDDASASVPWQELDSRRTSLIDATCIPSGLATLKPSSMPLHDVYALYSHIIKIQDSDHAFKFKDDCKSLHSAPTPANSVEQKEDIPTRRSQAGNVSDNAQHDPVAPSQADINAVSRKPEDGSERAPNVNVDVGGGDAGVTDDARSNIKKNQPKHPSSKPRGRPAKHKADGVGETNGEELKVAKRAKVAISESSMPAVGLKTRRAYARNGEKPSTHA